MQDRPVFWFSSDRKRIINLAAVCHIYRGKDGWTVWTMDCGGHGFGIAEEDGPSFLDAINAYSRVIPEGAS